MIEELLNQDTPSFDMLCTIAEKTLRPAVIYWCKSEDCLKGRKYEDDLMQEIHLRLIKTTVDYFLLKEGMHGEINNNPEGFKRWIFKVATNIKRDFCNRIRRDDFNTSELDDSIENEWTEDNLSEEEIIKSLNNAFQIVLESNNSAYKTLTWLAQMIFILEFDITKKKSNVLIVETFQNKTLFEMFYMIKSASKKIPWIEIPVEQDDIILHLLNKPFDDNKVYGDVEYHTFFMKKGGINSISDWVNRINNKVRRSLEDGSS